MLFVNIIKKVLSFRYPCIRMWENIVSRLRYPCAYLWRFLLFRTTIIAVSGSTGKTTTKELLASILSSTYSTAKTSGTWNAFRFGGVAGTLLSVRPWHRYAVIETAIEIPGDMCRLVKILRPDIVVMLGVGLCHTNTFKTLENIVNEKSELVRSLPSNKLAILNGNDKHVLAMGSLGSFKTMIYGESKEAEVRGFGETSRWPGRLELQVSHQGETHWIKTDLIGTHWVDSILAALAAGIACGVPLPDAIRAIESVKPFWARMQPVTLPNGATFIRDEWNGSLTTFEKAFSVMEQAIAERKIFVLSDFSDSSLSPRDRARRLGRHTARVADFGIFIGERSMYAKQAAQKAGMPPENVRSFFTVAEAAAFLKNELRAGDLVMLKGRTSDHLSRVFLAQLGEVTCMENSCRRQILCDRCGQMGFRWSSKLEGYMAPPQIFV